MKFFEGTGFEPEDLRVFYRSVRKSIILTFFNKRSLSELFKLEDRCQWPLLQRLADPALLVYRDADRNLLDAFIKSINDEKALRAERSKMNRDEYWRALFGIIEGRLEMFKTIFNFCNKDVKRCLVVAERYKRSRQRRIKDGKKLWKFGIGSGATALAGAAVLLQLRTRKR
ncbi:MAG TPA: hypothetical protein VFG09_03160 [Thermodesulfovibrionales bacterium]|nr:hypothetical protein [Thermodesulfovibrionales bacterium]